MNILEQKNIRSPAGKDDICAKFTIDDTGSPYVLHDVAEENQEYTLSFWCYSETDGEITAGGLDMSTSTEWTRYVVTFISDSVDVSIYFNIAGTYHIYNAQLEIGCKATDFALNPADAEEDLEALTVIVNSHTTQFTVMDGKIAGLIDENTTIRGEYDTLAERTADLELSLDAFSVELESTKTTISENYISLQEYTDTQITAKAEEISLSVANTYSTKTELETVDGKVTTLEDWQSEASQKITKDGIIATVGNYYAYQSDLDTVENRVTEAESQILQQADKIELCVEKDGIINAINLSTEEVKIAAARITLAGATIADSFTATNLHITGNSTFDGILNGATGSFSGSLTSKSGNIGGFDISSDKLSGANINIYAGSTSTESYIELLGAHVSLQNNTKISASGVYAKCWSAYATGYSTTYYPSGDPNTSVGTRTYGTYGIIKLGTYLDYPANKETTNITLNGLSGSISATGHIAAGGYVNNHQYASLSTKGLISSDWIRTAGNFGWYSESYGGGWYMSDSTWIRSYGNKNVYCDAVIRADGGLKIGEKTHYANGFVELYGNTPYIDFHFNNSTADLTSRIIEESAGNLTFTHNVKVNGELKFIDYSGTDRRPVSSAKTDGHRVSYMASKVNSSSTYYLVVQGQYGTTSSTYETHNFTSTSSDVRLKDNIVDTNVEALPLINQIRLRSFDWRNGAHQGIGFVADELELIDPALAFGGGYDEDGNMNVKGVNEFYLTGYLTKGIQELYSAQVEHTDRILTVEARQDNQQLLIEQLMDENAKLKKRVAQLEEQQAA